MQQLTVDFSKSSGPMKPMNAVNNGPLKKRSDQTNHNFDTYTQARFPYARTHDASFCSSYGGEHSVDIVAIFPDFDADPENPASYDFVLTDEYLLRTLSAGTQILFRLGHKIEHNIKKYGTLPPKDFKKWAVICEHVIRHVNEGWADGHHMGITYWEIWNEPDLDPDDSNNKRCWGGTKAQFFDLYEITAKHLKSCFPALKIGGPAISGKMDWAQDFLAEMQRRNVPMDFFSWHCYAFVPEKIFNRVNQIHALMERYGYGNVESILNEWNYVKGWSDEWVYSIEAMNGQKGAAFASAVISTCQYLPVDMLMYYDARPGSMNGLFDYYTSRPKPTYHPYFKFADMVELGTAVPADNGEHLYTVAAKGQDKYALMVTHFNDDDTAAKEQVCLKLRNVTHTGVAKVDCYRMNGQGEPVLFRSEYFTGENFDIYLDLQLWEIDYLTITPAEL